RGMGGLHPPGFTAQQRQELAERILPQLKAACGDEEWIVRYAVAVGLEGMDHWWQPPAAQRHRLLDALRPLADPQREVAPVVWLRARLALNRLVTAASAARA
ncbi:MAG: HEAT repeat domain-containing protein, partial [Cyanobacteria bacterium MAG IRC1_bin_28]|nr:HEAT repeat domain-containing protein [Cyanobacteria bacterium MAG IRC1_bin_28]